MKKIIYVGDDGYMILGTVSASTDLSNDELKQQYGLADTILRNNDKETGCTIHFVTDKVDRGPILIQKKCNVEPNDTAQSLKTKVQDLEGSAFLEAIKLFETKNVFHNG